MVDEPDSLVLRYLRRIDERLDTIDGKRDQLILRVSAIERDFAGMKQDMAGRNARIDGLDRKIARIERQLQLTDT